MAEPVDPFDPIEGRCNARKTNGEGLCRNEAGKRTEHLGAGQCYLHGGCTPSSTANAKRILLDRHVAELRQEYQPQTEGLNAPAALLEVLAFVIGMRRTYAALVDDLLAGDLVQTMTWGDQRSHVLETRLAHWTAESARVAKMAIDAGIAERRIQIEEAQAEDLSRFIRGVLLELGVWDRPEAPEVVERHLRVLTGGGADEAA